MKLHWNCKGGRRQHDERLNGVVSVGRESPSFETFYDFHLSALPMGIPTKLLCNNSGISHVIPCGAEDWRTDISDQINLAEVAILCIFPLCSIIYLTHLTTAASRKRLNELAIIKLQRLAFWRYWRRRRSGLSDASVSHACCCKDREIRHDYCTRTG